VRLESIDCNGHMSVGY